MADKGLLTPAQQQQADFGDMEFGLEVASLLGPVGSEAINTEDLIYVDSPGGSNVNLHGQFIPPASKAVKTKESFEESRAAQATSIVGADPDEVFRLMMDRPDDPSILLFQDTGKDILVAAHEIRHKQFNMIREAPDETGDERRDKAMKSLKASIPDTRREEKYNRLWDAYRSDDPMLWLLHAQDAAAAKTPRGKSITVEAQLKEFRRLLENVKLKKFHEVEANMDRVRGNPEPAGRGVFGLSKDTLEEQYEDLAVTRLNRVEAWLKDKEDRLLPKK
jgi:hypothetical protein